MQTLPLRQLYHPIQPTVQQQGYAVAYQEILPHPQLRQLIYGYWRLETGALAQPMTYRLVADGCVDVFFALDDPAESYVMGFYKQCTTLPVTRAFCYVGMRFFPTVFPALFGIKAKEVSNRFERLEGVVGDLARFIRTHFSVVDDVGSLKQKLDGYLLRQLARQPLAVDGRFQAALDLILQHMGQVTLQKDLKTGLSPRQLRRYFEFYIGDTAKTSSRMLRFWALPASQAYFEAGYYDQAHFIKEFKHFYGTTPGQAFGP